MPRPLSVLPSHAAEPRFMPSLLEGLDEPVRRFFGHAIDQGAVIGGGVRLRMTGRIKVGLWLPFVAEQIGDGRSFTWKARVGRGAFAPLTVVDRYADGAGSTAGRLLGRATVFHADDLDTTRSSAFRSAIESVAFAPQCVLPGSGVAWRAETDEVIVARFDLKPEHPEVRVRIDASGAMRSVWTERWGDVGETSFGYLPFGGEILAERRFGDLVLPSSLRVGWWFGTPRYAPFFEARIREVRQTS